MEQKQNNIEINLLYKITCTTSEATTVHLLEGKQLFCCVGSNLLCARAFSI